MVSLNLEEDDYDTNNFQNHQSKGHVVSISNQSTD
jgi:hypothetical protein